jgi:hypothetical protein
MAFKSLLDVTFDLSCKSVTYMCQKPFPNGVFGVGNKLIRRLAMLVLGVTIGVVQFDKPLNGPFLSSIGSPM